MSRLSDLFNTTDADWMDNPGRNCADLNRADEWYPADEHQQRGTAQARRREQYAAAICAGCPVLDSCLRYALENDERWGVWGGTTPGMRAEMREGGAA